MSNITGIKEPTWEEDVAACMEVFSKTNFKPKQFGDLFEGSVITPFIASKVTESSLKAIREEFVSWDDAAVSSVSEMLFVGVEEQDAVRVMGFLRKLKQERICIENASQEQLEASWCA